MQHKEIHDPWKNRRFISVAGDYINPLRVVSLERCTVKDGSVKLIVDTGGEVRYYYEPLGRNETMSEAMDRVAKLVLGLG